MILCKFCERFNDKTRLCPLLSQHHPSGRFVVPMGITKVNCTGFIQKRYFADVVYFYGDKQYFRYSLKSKNHERKN